MHGLIAHIINLPIKKSYDPHMTLISTKNKEYEKEVKKFLSLYEPISDKFVLSLGKLDDIGQLIEVIHCCEN
jgi:2'-5' RNA ligase